IGGFRNRKDHEYTSYANALKNFEMKMHSINEVSNKKDSIIIDSWNPDRKEMLTVEATDKMRKEIARQRQIMGNATMIQEKKNYTVDLKEAECCKVDKECAATQKNNISKKSDGKGEPTGQGGDPFTVKSKKCVKGSKSVCKPVMEGEQVLGWNENEDYLDTTHGTEIGDTAPFTEGEGTEKEMKNGTVEEGAVMHNAQNQNTPAVGVGEVGDDAPFDETVKEEMEGEEVLTEEGDELETEEPMEDMEEEPMEDEMSDDELMDDEMGDEEVDFESDLDDMTDEVEAEEEFDGDMETRLSAIEDLLAKIADKVGVSTFEDDDLYDDENVEDAEGEDDFLADDEMDMEEPEVDGEEIEVDDMEDDEDDVEIYESKNFRKAMLKEEEFHYFGQHPAYQKEPMELPEPNHQEKEGYYDMNDDSVENTEAFGNKIGDGAPFEVDPQAIENAIAECVKRILKKKI
ncbi:MAG: hypothetical protein J6V44_06885, partial [Methanobrevibacter sp.]|nr:hypothetical protein [Methanobrevibacter sp.]